MCEQLKRWGYWIETIGWTSTLNYSHHRLPPPRNKRIQKQALQMLDRDDWVEKYAWYAMVTYDWLGELLRLLFAIFAVLWVVRGSLICSATVTYAWLGKELAG